ncbi:metal-sensing transcriptional repressor [Candidatus Peregrinibacteria bacterium]|nr:metal-sensing transcriptional repressor [Candidatus Peregrinibacteria bacterium]
MKNERCKALVDHISRIQGQLDTLKKYINNNQSCEDITLLTSSVTKSFDSVRKKIVEGYIIEEILSKKIYSKSHKTVLENLKKIF